MRTGRPHRSFRPRCLILGMVGAWIVALYGSTFLAVLFGPLTSDAPLAAMWELTGRVRLPVKLGQALLLAGFLFASRLIPMSPVLRTATDAMLGAAAMFFLILLLPPGWTAGFDPVVTGTGLAPMLPYLVGGSLSGLIFALADLKCGELKDRSQET